MARVLITGGAGFIGTHTACVLLEAGHELVVFDNFANSSPEALRRVVELVGGDAGLRLQVVEGVGEIREIQSRLAAAAASVGFTA